MLNDKERGQIEGRLQTSKLFAQGNCQVAQSIQESPLELLKSSWSNTEQI